MIKERIAELNLPELLELNNGAKVQSSEDFEKRHAEILKLYQENEFGISPAAPSGVRGDIVSEDKNAFGGKATAADINISFDTPEGEFSFPCKFYIPNASGKYPLFVHISFNSEKSEQLPIEQMIDNGFIYSNFDYQTVTEDKNDGFSSGIAEMYGERGQADSYTWGKIAMWAFAASRVVDFAESLPSVDTENIAVIGHSRLGKTALWAGSNDKRFKYAFSNDSGCAGAAMSRDSMVRDGAEKIVNITNGYPCWFCNKYNSYSDRENELPFDQNFLLSLMAPRYVYVASASKDQWANPIGEYLSCAAASESWEICGKEGFKYADRYPESGDIFADGNIGYHMREGEHGLREYDWFRYMEFIKSKMTVK